MDHESKLTAPTPHTSKPIEQEAVLTTIVGGRPPGSGQPVGQIPRGIEVLIKKAAVDPEFKDLLLKNRTEAAQEIGLDLNPAEAMMLWAVPVTQLEKIIASTSVPEEHRRVFLGKVAVAMLAAMGITSSGCEQMGPTKGIRPDPLPPSRGIRPDLPPEKKEDKPPEKEKPDVIPLPAPTGSRPDKPGSKE